MHTTHAAEGCTEHTVVVFQFIGCTELERWRGANGGWRGCQLQQYEENLSYSLISTVQKLPDVMAEKLSWELQRFKEHMP